MLNSGLSFAGWHVAEKLDIPALAMLLWPMTPSRHLPGAVGKIPPAFSLGVTFVLLGGGILLSLWMTRRAESAAANDAQNKTAHGSAESTPSDGTQQRIAASG